VEEILIIKYRIVTVKTRNIEVVRTTNADRNSSSVRTEKKQVRSRADTRDDTLTYVITYLSSYYGEHCLQSRDT